MKSLALILSVLMPMAAFGADSFPDAGVVEVSSAKPLADGGVELGRGWWLSPGRMERVSEAIQERDRLKLQPIATVGGAEPPSVFTAFLWGVGVGVVLSAAIVTYAVARSVSH